MKKIKIVIIGIFQIIFFVNYAQVGINEISPNKASDLTLGSTNKALLLNRVELVNRTSPKPLSDNELTVGMVVFNTNETIELTQGLYFWSSDKRWNKMFTKTVATRQSNYIDFLQTKSIYKLTTPKVPFALKDLDYQYKAIEDGTIYLDYVLYSTLSNADFIGASKTTFVVTVLDSSGNQVFKGAVVISPIMVEKNTGSNSMAGKGNFFFNVVESETYKIGMTVVDNYKGKWANLLDVRVGDFSWGNNVAHSSLKLTFLSKPNM